MFWLENDPSNPWLPLWITSKMSGLGEEQESEHSWERERSMRSELSVSVWKRDLLFLPPKRWGGVIESVSPPGGDWERVSVSEAPCLGSAAGGRGRGYVCGSAGASRQHGGRQGKQAGRRSADTPRATTDQTKQIHARDAWRRRCHRAGPRMMINGRLVFSLCLSFLSFSSFNKKNWRGLRVFDHLWACGEGRDGSADQRLSGSAIAAARRQTPSVSP